MAFISVSISADMVRSPLSPRSSSNRERFISASSTFMRSASWMATMMYGVISSVRPRMSSMSNCSGSFSTRSSSTILAWSSTLLPSSPPPSRGCRLRMLEHSSSASRSLNPISALGCSPKAKGDSVGNVSVMNSMVWRWFSVLGGLLNLGKNSMPSSSSSLKYESRYMATVRRSQSSTTCPPYMISPMMYFRSSHGTLLLFSR
mmetsp:Transcript_14098/g.33837  ORF Transcript_14098/g.33837 Transcript_14098/m.33837 type:complete len:203 (-) Transcript_14098:4584-5192(-)